MSKSTSPANRSRRHRHGGFTLIELMVGISVLALIMAIAIPSFSNIVNNNRVVSGANNLVAALNFARSEAIKRGDSVTVCSSANGTSCAASTAWATGWIAFVDAAGTNGVVDAGDTVIQVWPAVDSPLTFTGTRNFIQYTSNGMPNPIPTGTPAQETFTIQKPSCTGNKARQVAVTLTGRVASAPVACS